MAGELVRRVGQNRVLLFLHGLEFAVLRLAHPVPRKFAKRMDHEMSTLIGGFFQKMYELNKVPLRQRVCSFS